MRKLACLFFIIAIISSSCVSYTQQITGSRFHSEDVEWKQFSSDVVLWLKDGIGSLTADDLKEVFGNSPGDGISSNKTFLMWYFRKVTNLKIDLTVYKRLSGEENTYFLIATFRDSRLIDFYLASSSLPTDGMILSSEEIVRIAAAGGAAILIGSMARKMVDDSIKEGVNQGIGQTP